MDHIQKTISEQYSPNFQLCNQAVDLEISLLPFQARLHLFFDPIYYINGLPKIPGSFQRELSLAKNG